MINIYQNRVIEFSFVSSEKYTDPFYDISFSALVKDESGKIKKVPGFWAGNNIWKFRFASPREGKYSFSTVCSNQFDTGLNQVQGSFKITQYKGNNPLYRHGPITVTQDKRHFQHYDKTPFLWLADTWWLGLSKRLSWPEEFNILANDRIKKGFNVIQIVAGLNPDMSAFDERGANESGHPWENGFTTINPDFFNMADKRISQLVEKGLMPCILGSWGYYMTFMNIDKMKKHWDYLYARYGAFPIVFCVAGEGVMPWYLSKTQTQDEHKLRTDWTKLCKYVKQINCFDRLISIHASGNGAEQINDYSLIDFEMIQTGHIPHQCVNNSFTQIQKSRERKPVFPVINAECCYEGIFMSSHADIQRQLFWISMLSGGAGHSYGANGVWQVNLPNDPFGLSPGGTSWGVRSWQEASQLAGAQHIGASKKFLENYKWNKIIPCQEIIHKDNEAENDIDFFYQPIAGKIPGHEYFVFYSPIQNLSKLQNLQADSKFNTQLANPENGIIEYSFGDLISDINGDLQLPPMPLARDWLLILTPVLETPL